MSESNYYEHVKDCLEGARNQRFCAGAESGAAEIKRLTVALEQATSERDTQAEVAALCYERVEKLEAALHPGKKACDCCEYQTYKGESFWGHRLSVRKSRRHWSSPSMVFSG